MVKVRTADDPLPDISTDGLPDPNISIPELDDMLKGGMGAMEQDQETPQETSAPGEESDSEGMPGMMGGMPGVPKGMENSPQAKIAEKLGKTPDPEGKAINLITSSIRTLNQLADTLVGTDEANAKAVRQIIRLLGEILKNAEHGGGTKPVMPMA